MDRDAIMGLMEQMVATVFKQASAGHAATACQGCLGTRCSACPHTRNVASNGVATAPNSWLPSHCIRRPLLQVVGVDVSPPFQRLTYAEAMGKYASGEWQFLSLAWLLNVWVPRRTFLIPACVQRGGAQRLTGARLPSVVPWSPRLAAAANCGPLQCGRPPACRQARPAVWPGDGRGDRHCAGLRLQARLHAIPCCSWCPLISHSSALCCACAICCFLGTSCCWQRALPACAPFRAAGSAGFECVPTQLACPPGPPLAHPACRVFAGAVAEGGIVKGMRVPEGKRISNSRVKPKGDVSSECPAAQAGGARAAGARHLGGGVHCRPRMLESTACTPRCASNLDCAGVGKSARHPNPHLSPLQTRRWPAAPRAWCTSG